MVASSRWFYASQQKDLIHHISLLLPYFSPFFSHLDLVYLIISLKVRLFKWALLKNVLTLTKAFDKDPLAFIRMGGYSNKHNITHIQKDATPFII